MMNPVVKVTILTTMAIALIMTMYPPTPVSAATHTVSPVSKVLSTSSNGCAGAPYRNQWGDVRVYLDNCNLTYLIKVFRQVGTGWEALKYIPVPIAQVFAAMGKIQSVAAVILSNVQSKCGSKGVTIYKYWWMPTPWYQCGKNW